MVAFMNDGGLGLDVPFATAKPFIGRELLETNVFARGGDL